jgi:hypothetical protein
MKTPTIRLQFRRHVAFSILDGLKAVGSLEPFYNECELLRIRVDEALVQALAHNQKFIRMRLADEDVECIKEILAQQVEKTETRPLLDELHEAYTRLVCLETTDVIQEGVEDPSYLHS